jgi:hypothetical protein
MATIGTRITDLHLTYFPREGQHDLVLVGEVV